MNTKRDVFHFDLINQFNNKVYDNALFPCHINDDEIAIKNPDIEEIEYFIPMKKDGINYLLPSEALKQLPVFPVITKKIAYRSKAYMKIISVQDLRILPVQTMSYKRMIDYWLSYEHEEKELFTLHKIIVETARTNRINLRIMTLPEWMKDSPLTVLGLLFGDCVTVNKPTMGKLKHLLPNNKVIGINEVNKINQDKKDDLAQYYEDTGDFKPVWVNSSRAISGSVESCNLGDCSSLTFYNLPGTNDYSEQYLFDFLFHDKVKNRIFPLFFKGGKINNDGSVVGACKERFGHVTNSITDLEVEELKVFLRNMEYYRVKFPNGSYRWNRSKKIEGTRWDRNFQTILSRVDLYCDSQEEFEKFESLLYGSHRSYLEYVFSMRY